MADTSRGLLIAFASSEPRGSSAMRVLLRLVLVRLVLLRLALLRLVLLRLVLLRLVLVRLVLLRLSVLQLHGAIRSMVGRRQSLWQSE